MNLVFTVNGKRYKDVDDFIRQKFLSKSDTVLLEEAMSWFYDNDYIDTLKYLDNEIKRTVSSSESVRMDRILVNAYLNFMYNNINKIYIKLLNPIICGCVNQAADTWGDDVFYLEDVGKNEQYVITDVPKIFSYRNDTSTLYVKYLRDKSGKCLIDGDPLTFNQLLAQIDSAINNIYNNSIDTTELYNKNNWHLISGECSCITRDFVVEFKVRCV